MIPKIRFQFGDPPRVIEVHFARVEKNVNFPLEGDGSTDVIEYQFFYADTHVQPMDVFRQSLIKNEINISMVTVGGNLTFGSQTYMSLTGLEGWINPFEKILD